MRRTLGFAAVCLGLLAGCPFSFTNEDHCAARAGDASCAADDPSTPYCAFDGCGLYDEVTNRTGCVAEQPTDMACHSPCGGKLDANAMNDCEAATEATTEATTDTDPASSVTGTTETPGTDPDSTDGCTCEGDTPICTDGACVPCMTDEECTASVGDGLLCHEGRCVPCAPTTDPLLPSRHAGCSDDAPNCVDDACAALCLLPEDCDSVACDPAEAACAPQGCDLLRGLCGPSERIYYVEDSDSAVENGDGSRESPFNSIDRALQESPPKTGPNDVSVGTILLAPGGVFAESISFRGKSIILRPSGPGAAPVISPLGKAPVFTLENDDSGEPGVLYLDHIRVQDAQGPVALLRSSTRFFSDGSEFLDNAAGIESEGGFAYLRNTVFARTTGAVFRVISDASLDIEASTIIDNQADLWLDCSASAKGQTRVGIRDSIVGLYDGPDFSTLISPECFLAEANNLLGNVGVEDDYRDDYRLELMPGEMFMIDSPETCELGVSALPGDELCAPRLDIDGKSRDGKLFAGASVP